MPPKAIEEYLEQRYMPQAEWYDKRSSLYKKLTFAFQVPIIAVSIVVPVLIALDIRTLAMWSSASVSAAIGILGFGRFERLWHLFRSTHEALRSEKVHFDHQTDVYDGVDDPEKLFIERTESLISRENVRWVLAVRRRRQ